MKVLSSTLALFLSVGYQCRIANSQYGDCNATAPGCSRTDGCHVEFVADAVYGCSGEWENSGVTNGDYLCADGYDICDSVEWAQELGLTYDLCMNATDFREYYYYISGIGYGSTYQECTENGTSGLFGCARMSDYLPWLDYLYDNTTCGPFGAYLDNDIAGNGNTSGDINPPAWAFGWEVWDNAANGQEDLVNYVRHIEAQAYQGGTTWSRVDGYYVGGLMCCANSSSYSTTNDHPTTNEYSTTNENSTTNEYSTTSDYASTIDTNASGGDDDDSTTTTMESSNTAGGNDTDSVNGLPPLTIFSWCLATLAVVKLLM